MTYKTAPFSLFCRVLVADDIIGFCLTQEKKNTTLLYPIIQLSYMLPLESLLSVVKMVYELST